MSIKQWFRTLPALKLLVTSVMADSTEVALAVIMLPALFFILAYDTPADTASAQFK